MIDFNQASQKAISYLEDMESDVGVPLQLMKVREDSFGWIFFYQSRAYMETKDFSAMLAGNAPFLIERETGELHVLGTAYSVERYIQDYVKNRVEMINVEPPQTT